MNKREYLDNLLALLTDFQRDIFNKMYPSGVNIKQLSWAITQAENTLKNLNEQKVEMRELERLHESEINDLASRLSEKNKKLSTAEEDLLEVSLLVERLRNPISMENNKIQEDIRLLDALRAAGVDNWDGWDDAIDIMRGRS